MWWTKLATVPVSRIAALYYRPTSNTEYNESFWLETLATWALVGDWFEARGAARITLIIKSDQIGGTYYQNQYGFITYACEKDNVWPDLVPVGTVTVTFCMRS